MQRKEFQVSFDKTWNLNKGSYLTPFCNKDLIPATSQVIQSNKLSELLPADY